MTDEKTSAALELVDARKNQWAGEAAPSSGRQEDRVSEELYLEYNVAIGSLMAARRRYDEVEAVHGSGNQATEQAQDSLNRAIEHRNEVRDRYDAAATARGRR